MTGLQQKGVVGEMVWASLLAPVEEACEGQRLADSQCVVEHERRRGRHRGWILSVQAVGEAVDELVSMVDVGFV